MNLENDKKNITTDRFYNGAGIDSALAALAQQFKNDPATLAAVNQAQAQAQSSDLSNNLGTTIDTLSGYIPTGSKSTGGTGTNNSGGAPLSVNTGFFSTNAGKAAIAGGVAVLIISGFLLYNRLKK